MSNLFAAGATLLASTLKNFAGVSVSYIRRGQAAVSFTATSRNQDYEVVTESTSTIITARDYTFTKADLDAESITPREGDRISETIAGVAYMFEVLPIGNKPCAEWLDKEGVMLIVHTKKVG